jgi:hypothetical protein
VEATWDLKTSLDGYPERGTWIADRGTWNLPPSSRWLGHQDLFLSWMDHRTWSVDLDLQDLVLDGWIVGRGSRTWIVDMQDLPLSWMDKRDGIADAGCWMVQELGLHVDGSRASYVLHQPCFTSTKR